MQICCVFPRTVHKTVFIYAQKIETWKVFVRCMTYVGNEPQSMQKRKGDGLTTCIFLQQFLAQVGFRSCHAKVNCTRICTAGRAAGYANVFAKYCNYISAMGYRLLFFPVFVRKCKQQHWKFRESVQALK
jgi:hypothetical protein